jgi:hypothetical protein
MESLPVLYIRARNHYDVGFAIGITFKGEHLPFKAFNSLHAG